MPKFQYIDAKRIEVRASATGVVLGYVEKQPGSKTAEGYLFKAFDLEGGTSEHRGLQPAIDRLTSWLNVA